MIVTLKLLGAMRSGKVTTAFMPAMRASDWTVGKRIGLRRLIEREEQRRTTIPLYEGHPDNRVQVSIEVASVGEPIPFHEITLRQANQAGFKTLQDLAQFRSAIYTTRECRDDVLSVRFSMVVDRPRLLTAKAHTLSTTDYTQSSAKAMRGEPEALVIPSARIGA